MSLIKIYEKYKHFDGVLSNLEKNYDLTITEKILYDLWNVIKKELKKESIIVRDGNKHFR